MRKAISVLQLRRTIQSKWRRGTNPWKFERKMKTIERRISRQIRPLAAIAAGDQHRNWRSGFDSKDAMTQMTLR